MPLLNLIVPLIVVGVVLWLINRYIPMASSIKTILNVVVVVVVCVWVLQSVGLWSQMSTFPASRVIDISDFKERTTCFGLYV